MGSGCFFYRGDDIVDQISLDPIRADGGTSGMVEVDEDIEKARVSFKLLPDDSQYASLIDNARRYTVTVTYLDKNQHNIIYIDGETFLSKSLTKSTRVKLLELFNAQNYMK